MKGKFYTPREFHIRKGAIKIADKKSDAVAYLGPDIPDRLFAKVFFGKQAKPVANYSFRNEAEREKTVTDYFNRRRAWLAGKAEARTTAKRVKLELGHILETCWGYDQTNREFYQVTKLVGRTMVEVREIAQVRDATGWEQGTATPKLDEFIGEPKRCKINAYGIRVDSHLASIWDGQPVRWSSYA